MTINAMAVPAGTALRVLEAGWQAQMTGAMTAAYMLHGRPGVGKTQIVQSLADQKGAKLFDLRLTMLEPQDLRGLPYYDHERQKTVWYRPEDLPDTPNQPAVLFLDELTAAPPALHPAVYGLLYERRVGLHRLPDSVFVVAAGNQVEDGAVAYEMGTALADRLVHLAVIADAEDWVRSFAVPAGIDAAVIAFIRTRPDFLETSERALADGLTIAATPRSWVRVSQIMASVTDRAVRRIMVAGTVGDAVAAEFFVVADEVAATVQVADMLAAPEADRWALYPASLHGLNAMIYGLVAALDKTTLSAVIASMTGVQSLAARRGEAVFGTLPLAELTSYGMELLMGQALSAGLGKDFAADPAYRAYAEAREMADA